MQMLGFDWNQEKNLETAKLGKKKKKKKIIFAYCKQTFQDTSSLMM